jgi:hypothetical protein
VGNKGSEKFYQEEYQPDYWSLQFYL